MQIGKTLYVTNRVEWRNWLEKYHEKEKEIWLIFFKKSSEKPRLPYNDAVEEALCFGWIDSIVKPIDEKSFAQRFTPRRKGSSFSELNKERLRLMQKAGKIVKAGHESFKEIKQEIHSKKLRLKISPKILKELKNDKNSWKNFQKFPANYKAPPHRNFLS